MSVARKYRLALKAAIVASVATVLGSMGLVASVVAGMMPISSLSVAMTAVFVVCSTVVMTSMAVFMAHAWRRNTIARGRRLGWIVYMLVAPWAALPAYYSEEVVPNVAKAAETVESSDMPEVVLPSPSHRDDDVASVSLIAHRDR